MNIHNLLNSDGHILFLKLLGAVSEINSSEKMDFIKKVLKLDSCNYSNEQILDMAEDVFQISEGYKPIPQYCTGFRKNPL